MAIEFDRGMLEDTETAFRHESLLRLLHRTAVFTGMGLGPFSDFMQSIAVSQIHNPLGRLLTRLSAGLFMGGESLEECSRVLEGVARYQAGGILDYLVESDDDPGGRDHTLSKLLEGVDYASRNQVPYVACKPSGLMDLAVLGKIQAGADLTPEEVQSFEAGKQRLTTLAEAAEAGGVRLFVDAEWVYMTEPVDAMVLELMRRFNREHPVVFHTLQMYLTRMPAYLESLLELSREEGWIFACKLVRGAYLEHERETHPVDPTCPDLATTHRQYDEALRTCVEHLDHAAIVVASHNQASCALAVELLLERGLPLTGGRMEFAQLLGMSDTLTYNLAALGATASKYIPYGPLEKSLPYLVRRAQENRAATEDSARERDTLWREVRRRLGI